MVYTLKNIHQNMHMGEMPTDIIYSRTGGCFVSITHSIILSALITFTGIFLGLVIFYSTKNAYEQQVIPTIQNYVNSTAKTHETEDYTNRVVPKNYRIEIYPIFNATENSFTFTGRAHILITPKDDLTELFIKCNDLEIINLESLLIQHVNYKSSPPASPVTQETEISLLDYVEIANDDKSTKEVVTMENFYEEETVIPTAEEPEMASNEELRLKRSTSINSNASTTLEATYTEVLIKKVYASDGVIFVSLGIYLQDESDYVVQIEFGGSMTRVDGGLLYAEYKDENDNDSYFASTTSVSELNPPIFPTIPTVSQAQTTFDLSITHPDYMLVITNSQLERTHAESISDAQLKIDTFKTTRPIHIENFGFALTRNQPTIVTINANLTVYTYFRSDIFPILGIDDYLPKILNTFINITGVDYPTNKINFVGIPNSADGIEVATLDLIVASESTCIIHEDAKKSGQISALSYLLAKLWSQPIEQHNRPDELWINDALPLYLSEAVGKSHEVDEFFYSKQRILLENEIKLHELKQLDDISSKFILAKLRQYDTNATKGLFLLKTFEQLLGRGNFTKALQLHFFERHQNRNSSLLEHLEDIFFENSVDINVFSIAKSWMTVNSYPIVHIKRKTNRLIITQRNLSMKNVANSTVYSIPITFISSNNSENIDRLLLVTSATTIIEDYFLENSTWFIANPLGIGYYRVNYDAENWLAIILSNFKELDTNTKATLLDDAFSLARVGLLDYSVAFNLSERILHTEAEHLTFKIFLHHMNFICRLTRDMDIYTKIRNYTVEALTYYNNRTEFFKTNPSSLKRLLSENPCILSQNMKGIHPILTIDLEPETIPKTFNEKNEMFLRNCVIARQGSSSEYNLLKDKLQLNDVSLQQIAIKSLGCSQIPDNLNNLFKLIYDDDFKPFVSDILEAAAINNEIGKILFLKMLYDEFEKITAHVDLESILTVFESITTKFELKLLEDIFTKHSAHFDDKHRSALKYVVNNINQTLFWKKTIAQKLEEIDWNPKSR